jgi:hypothetical protein
MSKLGPGPFGQRAVRPGGRPPELAAHPNWRPASFGRSGQSGQFGRRPLGYFAS